jgi:hypothetical protein
VKMIDSEHYKKHANFSFYRNVEKEGILIGWRSWSNIWKVIRTIKNRISKF